MRSGLQELPSSEDRERRQGRRIRLFPAGEYPCKRGQNVSARLNSLSDCRVDVEAPLFPIRKVFQINRSETPSVNDTCPVGQRCACDNGDIGVGDLSAGTYGCRRCRYRAVEAGSAVLWRGRYHTKRCCKSSPRGWPSVYALWAEQYQ